jgi:26S proteasome regulatory subunit T1
MLTEILKNSFRATVENYHRSHPQSGSRSNALPSVRITLSPPPAIPNSSSTLSNFYSIRIRDQGGGVPPSHIPKIFSYAFTTAGRNAENDSASDSYDHDPGDGGGPYAAQHVGGIAAIGGAGAPGGGNLFGEITGKGLQTGLGTIAGLGYGLPMSRLYAK